MIRSNNSVALLLLITGLLIISFPNSGFSQQYEMDYLGSELWSSIADVAVSGNYAYCACPAGIMVLDISDLSSPETVNKILLPGKEAKMIESRDNFLYLLTGHSLYTLAIDDPVNPEIRSELNLQNELTSFTIIGNYAYTAGDRLNIVDISDIDSPLLTGQIDLPSNCRAIAVWNTYVYLVSNGNANNIIYQYDISDNSNPVYYSEYPLLAKCGNISVYQNYLYVSVEGEGVRILDIGTPGNFELAASIAETVTNNLMYLDSNLLYFGADPGFRLYDIVDPVNPVYLSSYEISFAESYVMPFSMTVSGPNAFVADNRNLEIVNESNPTTPIRIGYMDFGKSSFRFLINGDYAFVCNLDNLSVIDISDPGSPVLIGAYYEISHPSDIAISGNYAYITNGSTLKIVDISDVFNLQIVEEISSLNNTINIAIDGYYAYVICTVYGLAVLDISNPVAPQLVADIFPISISGGGAPNIRHIIIEGNYAYYSNGANLLVILDVSDPTQPQIVGHLQSDTGADRAAIIGDYLYLSGRWVGNYNVEIVDISDKSNPVVVGEYEGIGNCYTMEIIGNLAFVGVNGEGDGLAYGIEILNIENPLSPQYAGSIPGNDFTDIHVIENYIYGVSTSAFYTLQYAQGGCGYTTGDFNGSGRFNIADIIDAFNFISTGSPESATICECPPGSGDFWPVAMDVNNNCMFNLADILIGFSKLQTGTPELVPCLECLQ